ncbi:VOC family protein [Vibrio ostreicida]|uniref:VOC family protein n=1 Tax=Vibrio ostreicida TaxID=526588 RepID=A0ABT8BQI8_9VIBR|nr:VOC family protein [Vibrio ostreicida]MDN3608719.1 VOC family protein [Vibrio ostreicida]NPD10598.1 VOC family protein [Vibrio ostreicida]
MSGQLHHVSLTVSDLTASERFYALFGFEKTQCYQDQQVTIQMFESQGSRIELFHFNEEGIPSKSESLIQLKHLGITHFALSVRDLETFHKKLSEVTKTTTIYQARLGSFRYFFCSDPDGNQVEVLEE